MYQQCNRDFLQKVLIQDSPALNLFFVLEHTIVTGFLKCHRILVMMLILPCAYVTLPTKVRLVKAMVSPVVMYGCENWTVKKAEHRRIDAFELWCWRRLSRVPWTARRSNQSILKEISPGCSLEGMMLKLKLQYFGHLMLMWRVDSLEKLWCWEGLGAGGEGDDRGWDGWMASMDMSLSELWELVMDMEA